MSNPQRDDPFENMLLYDLLLLKIKTLKVCPNCNKKYKLSDIYRIRSRPIFTHTCGKQIGPRSGTIMEKSKTPIGRWFLVIVWMVDEPDITISEINRRLSGSTYKTVWRMFHRIRSLSGPKDHELVELAIKRMKLGSKL